MECHLCPHNEDVASGKYRGMAFETTPCAACELKDDPGFAIAFNSEHPAAAAVVSGGPEETDPMRDQGLPVSALWELVVTLLLLPPRTRDILCWRYAGYKYHEIALVQRVTKSAVELRHRNALKRFPLLRALFPAKAGKHDGRRRHAAAGVEVRK